jgi:hypothetical protein
MSVLSLSSEYAVTFPPTARSPEEALNENAVAVVLTLAVWFEPAPATNTG